MHKTISLVSVSYQRNLLGPGNCDISVDIYLTSWRCYVAHTTMDVDHARWCSSTFQSGCGDEVRHRGGFRLCEALGKRGLARPLLHKFV
jgi:hypothetical protein